MAFNHKSCFYKCASVLTMPTVTDKQARTTAAGVVISYVRMGRKYGAVRK